MEILTEYCSSGIMFAANTAMANGVEKGEKGWGERGRQQTENVSSLERKYCINSVPFWGDFKEPFVQKYSK